MICTLSFEHFCHKCKDCVLFTAVSIPSDLSEEYIEHYIQHSATDYCYDCHVKMQDKKSGFVTPDKKLITSLKP